MSWFGRRPSCDAARVVERHSDAEWCVCCWTLLGPITPASGTLAVFASDVEPGRFHAADPVSRVVRAVPVACWALARTEYEVRRLGRGGRDRVIYTLAGARRLVGMVPDPPVSLGTIGRMCIADADPAFCGYASSREEVQALVRAVAGVVLADGVLWRELDDAGALVRETP